MRGSFRWSRCCPVLAWGCLLGLVSCDEDETATTTKEDEIAVKGQLTKPDQGPVPSKDHSPTTNEAEPSAQRESSHAACPKGKYLFDYSKVDLQGVLTHGGGPLRVLTQEGKATCTFDAPPPGTWACTIDDPFVAEIKVEQGIDMTMKLNMTGSAKVIYQAAGPNQFKVASTDLTGFEMTGSMTMGGKELPLPFDQFPKMFGEDGNVWSYECRPTELYMKMQTPGGPVVEHHLEPM